MGFDRLLRCCSRQLRFANVTLNLLRNTSASSKTLRITSASSRVGTFSGIFGHTCRQLAARRKLCSSAEPPRDVTLFVHDRTRLLRLISVFCGGQFVFWTYMAHFAYTELRDTSGSKEKVKTKAPATTITWLDGMWSFEMNMGSNSWKYGFTLVCLATGAAIVGLGTLFCRRSVSKVVLHQGGRMVTVYTQSPLGAGRGRIITVPLSQVACHAHRQETASFIPLKIKGYKFYFLLDKEGTVNNARLFDITVGAYRSL